MKKSFRGRCACPILGKVDRVKQLDLFLDNPDYPDGWFYRERKFYVLSSKEDVSAGEPEQF